MNEAGSQNGDGSGNGNPPNANRVSESSLYRGLCAALEARYPRLKDELFFAGLRALMVVYDPPEEAQFVGGTTWMMRAPENPEYGVLTIYFTWAPGQITLQAVDGSEEEGLLPEGFGEDS